MIQTGRATSSLRQSLRVLSLLVLLLAVPVGSSGQGCPMCRETAAFQKGRAVDSLKRGIVALAIPPAGIFLGLAWLTWKRSNRFSTD